MFLSALAGVAQWIERDPLKQRVARLILSRCMPAWVEGGSPVGDLWEVATH